MLERITRVASHSPLQGRPTTPDTAEPGGAAVGVLPAMAQFSVRLSQRHNLPTEMAGLPVDTPLNSCRDGAGRRRILRLGPDEWLVLSLREEADGLSEDLRQDLAGTPHALVDIGHRGVALEVSGPLAGDILAAGCPLDISLRGVPSGMATRTIYAKCEIVLIRPNAGNYFEVLVWRSFSRYLFQHLSQAETMCAAVARYNT